ncbi:MAG: hypothetical protein ACT4QE_25385 [Anaerolineales bacterium]
MTTTKSLIPRVLQILETGFLASLVSGVIVGILARAAMTALTLAGGRSNEFPPFTFTVPGAITIVTLTMLAGIPIAVLLLIFWRFIPGSGWMKMFSAGVVTFVFPGLLLLTDSSFKINDANWYYGIALFAPLHFGYGLLMGFMIETLNKRAATPNLIVRNGWARWKKIILPAMFVALVILYYWADAIAFNR